jgi:hypothetical protein
MTFHGIDRWVRRIRAAEAEDGAGPAEVGSVRRSVTRSGNTFAEWYGDHVAGVAK